MEHSQKLYEQFTGSYSKKSREQQAEKDAAAAAAAKSAKPATRYPFSPPKKLTTPLE